LRERGRCEDSVEIVDCFGRELGMTLACACLLPCMAFDSWPSALDQNRYVICSTVNACRMVDTVLYTYLYDFLKYLVQFSFDDIVMIGTVC